MYIEINCERGLLRHPPARYCQTGPAQAMYALYTSLLILFFAVSLPGLFWQYLFTPKYRGTLRERLGKLPCGGLDKAKTPCIWVHAVSVGEVMAAKGLVERLRLRYPKYRILLSTVTKTGREVARSQLPHVNLFYFPLDFPWVVNKVVATIKPRFLVVLETELWPNLFRACHAQHIPVIVVNGRLSAASTRRYTLVAPLMAQFLRPVHHFSMQSEADAQRLLRLGVAPHRVMVSGNLKYDQALSLPDQPLPEELQQRLTVDDAPIWLAASTHPGEENTILASYLHLRQRQGNLRLILAPRHPERTGQVAGLIRDHHLEPVLFSQLRGPWQPDEVLLLDKVGWLFRLYSIARVVFVGGSLTPHGGQNMLEPAAWGIPPIFGPHTFHFREVVQQLREADAAVEIKEGKELATAILGLLQDENRRTAMGARAQFVVEDNVGALDRTMDIFRSNY